ncbi:MAG: hypothetical protein RLZZ238_1770 [Planctomycetota bacterium]
MLQKNAAAHPNASATVPRSTMRRPRSDRMCRQIQTLPGASTAQPTASRKSASVRSDMPFPFAAQPSPSRAFFASHSAVSRLFSVASGLPVRIASISRPVRCIALRR